MLSKQVEHIHPLCEYCGLTDYRCRRHHDLRLKDEICQSCQDAERADWPTLVEAREPDEDYEADRPTYEEGST